MRVPRPLIAAALSAWTAGVIACDDALPPQGQIVVYIDTDAPVAPASSVLEPAPLFDRLLVEIYEPGRVVPCADCRREIVVDASLMAARRFSFGFVPRPHLVGYRARLVLYRSTSGLPPRTASSVEMVGYLPAVAEDGKKSVTVRFRVEDVATPRGTVENPILFDAGELATSAIGTWPGARVVDCERSAPPGTVCIPGGAFWMGDPRVAAAADDEAASGAREHIAILPPFFLDSAEVTIGQIRTSGFARLDSRSRALDPRDDLADTFGRCDYSSAAGPREAIPVNCVSWGLARSYCRARGGDLPSEAELEIVASRRGAALAPWGDHDPSCAEAKVGGCDAVDEFALDRRVFPALAGSGSHDRVAMPTGEVFDLGANLAEWTRDAFEPDDGACWSRSILEAPSCVPSPTNEKRSVKGADLVTIPSPFAQVRRGYDRESTSLAHVGFRCAYPAY